MNVLMHCRVLRLSNLNSPYNYKPTVSLQCECPYALSGLKTKQMISYDKDSQDKEFLLKYEFTRVLKRGLKTGKK